MNDFHLWRKKHVSRNPMTTDPWKRSITEPLKRQNPLKIGIPVVLVALRLCLIIILSLEILAGDPCFALVLERRMMQN